jgi:hypothetical protein
VAESRREPRILGDQLNPLAAPSWGTVTWNTTGFEGAYYILVAERQWLEDGSIIDVVCDIYEHPAQVTILLKPPTPVLSPPRFRPSIRA